MFFQSFSSWFTPNPPTYAPPCRLVHIVYSKLSLISLNSDQWISGPVSLTENLTELPAEKPKKNGTYYKVETESPAHSSSSNNSNNSSSSNSLSVTTNRPMNVSTFQTTECL